MTSKLKQLVMGVMMFFGAMGSGMANEIYEQAWKRINNGALLIDTRTQQEYDSGHIPGSINIPYEQVVERLTAKGISPDTDIVLYCRSGNRSGIAEQSLINAGYRNTLNAGGYEALNSHKPE